ncbi:DNA/RNA non-specific endonuclease [Mollicutes bacterium LVI A0039]|nr:DNA/RNA non-specific endonuclease [Mollicutes bacterium LVI A0039]
MKNKRNNNYQGKYYDPNYHQNKRKYGDKYDPRKFSVKNPNYRRRNQNKANFILNLIGIAVALSVFSTVYFDLDLPNIFEQNSDSLSFSPDVLDNPEASGVATDPSSLLNNREITVDACDNNGAREANVKVDVGYADRVYFGYTNEYRQLAYVTADQIIPQYKYEENSDNRYCDGQANVEGASSPYNRGHAIGDALGGVSNAYNIFPQLQTVNSGKYNDNEMRLNEIINNGGTITNFEIILEYPNSSTNVPSSYTVQYYVNGELETKTFSN